MRQKASLIGSRIRCISTSFSKAKDDFESEPHCTLQISIGALICNTNGVVLRSKIAEALAELDYNLRR